MTVPTSAPLLNARQVAAELGINRATIYKLIHRGLLPAPLKIGGASRWRVKDVEDLKYGRRQLRPRGGRRGATQEG